MKPNPLKTSTFISLSMLVTVITTLFYSTHAAPLGTAFTYQGQLNSDGNAATGLYDFSFALYDAASTGTQQGSTLTTNAVSVTNGYFIVVLDFGSAFDGNARWLDISVKTNAAGSYSPLAPRQPLTPTPYAMFANSAGSVSATNLTDTVPLAKLPGAVLTNNANSVNLSGSFAGNGAALTNLTAGQLTGIIPDARLSANVALLNASQTFTGQNNFKDPGTTNTGSLHVGGYAPNGDPKLIRFGDGSFVYLGENGSDDTMELRAARFFFNAGSVGIGTNNPSSMLHVVGTVAASAVGIGTVSPSDSLLEVQGDIRLSKHDLFLREGSDRNQGLGWYGAGKLFAGVNVDGPVLYGFGGGGLGSAGSTNLALRWIGNGQVIIDPTGLNAGSVTPGLTFGASSGEGIASVRAAGPNQFGLDFYTIFQRRLSLDNSGNLYVQGVVDTLGGTVTELRVNGTRALRLEQSVATNGAPNVIGGSVNNMVDSGYIGSFIGGGGATNWGGSAYNNRIMANFGVIGGGGNNLLSTNAGFATIGGGNNNSIQRNATFSTIAGGSANSIKTGASYSAIGGGSGNTIQTNSTYATVAGGRVNTIGTNSTVATIGGGFNNTITSNAPYATVPGGREAVASHYGQIAYSSGRFYNLGDAQASLLVLRASSFGTSAYTLALDGDTGTQFLTIPTGARWAFDILLVGSQTDGPAATFQIKGAIRNTGGVVAFVGTPTVTSLGADAGAATWTASVQANDTNDSLDIVVHGSGSVWTYWVANVRTVEVTPTN
jgi:hypothetical protein